MLLRTHTVRLPIDRQPTYPAECAGCGRAADTVLSAADLAHWARFWFPLAYLFAARVRRRAPACRRCRRVDRLSRWSRWSFFLVGCIALVWFVGGYLKELGWSRFQVKLGLTLAFFPPATLCYLWVVRFPRAFTIDAGKTTVEYHFARRAYAERFAAANGGFVGS